MPRPSHKTQTIHARVEPKLKASAKRVFSTLGISTTEAIRLFLNQVNLHQGLPFQVEVPNARTVAAMKETDETDSLKRYGSFRALREKI